jgi:hypothetical protein
VVSALCERKSHAVNSQLRFDRLGAGALAVKTMEALAAVPDTSFVVDSVRHPAEVAALRTGAATQNRVFRLICR